MWQVMDLYAKEGYKVMADHLGKASLDRQYDGIKSV
jgi:hypothetical protein